MSPLPPHLSGLHRGLLTLGTPAALIAALAVGAALALPAASQPGAGAPLAAAVTRAKPLPPLEVRLEPLDPLSPGRAVRFRLTVLPRVPTEEVRVRVRPAPAIAWVAGERAAVRPAGRDTAEVFEFTVRVPASGRHALHVEIEAVGADGRLWRRGAGLGLGPNPRAERARAVPDGRGGRALEFEAAPADRRAGSTR